MATVNIPNQQMRINDPYQQRLFDFGTSDSRLYLSRVSNQSLRTFGNDIVLRGLGIHSTSLSGSTATINMTGGLAIADHTLVQIDDEVITVDIDISPYDVGGKVIVHLNYEFLHTIEENPVRIQASYVDPTGNTISPNGWSVSKDRIVLGIFEFTKDGSNNITSFTEITDVVKSIIILGTTYFKLGYNPTEEQNLDEYFNNSSIINTKITVSPTDLDKKSLGEKITATDSSIRLETLTPQPDSEVINVRLDGDQESPGVDYLYTTDILGAKGWSPGPFSPDLSIFQKKFIDFASIVSSPVGAISYDARGNIDEIDQTLKSGEHLILKHSYSTRDDLNSIVAVSPTGLSEVVLWTKNFVYNNHGDVTGWQTTFY